MTPVALTAAMMLSVDDVAIMLNCSTRHIWRLADSGRMPRPVKLGNLRRWRRVTLEGWLEEGCPDLRKARAI